MEYLLTLFNASVIAVIIWLNGFMITMFIQYVYAYVHKAPYDDMSVRYWIDEVECMLLCAALWPLALIVLIYDIVRATWKGFIPTIMRLLAAPLERHHRARKHHTHHTHHRS